MKKLYELLMKLIGKILGFSFSIKNNTLNFTTKSKYGERNIYKILKQVAEKFKNE
jgi:hypothetical protein